MFILYADKNKLTVRQKEAVTSGSVNVCPVRFEFSEEWDGLTRTAVFRADGEPVSVPLDVSGECGVPWEVLERPLARLTAGVYGTAGGEVVLPTVWADLGMILTGAAPGKEARPPAPDLWEQELERKGDKLDYTPEGGLGLYAGEKLLSSVPVPSGGGGAVSMWKIGHGLKLENGVVSVQTAGSFAGDMTLPVTAAAVEAAVGNVEILLETI